MQLLILSDIHANLSALQAVIEDTKKYQIERTILLGDHIDYGMRPNEVISLLKDFLYPIDANIWGNHEKAIIDGDLEKFSSERGKAFSQYTKNILTGESKNYIQQEMNRNGFFECQYDNKQYLIVHASLENIFWKSISPETCLDKYIMYDYVLCGHSHLPFYFEKYLTIDNPDMRNRKKITFINPGAVGQPRNNNPRACYAVMDTIDGWIHLNNVVYNVENEQSLYGIDVDSFYKTRLSKGI
jgi:predicted phosphodiesterase